MNKDKENIEKGFLIVTTIMSWLIIFAIIIALLPSCSPRIQYIPLETKITDTVSITDTLIVRELQQHNDTVVVEATGGTASSFLSNPYCYSWATWVNGKLYHSLRTWPFAKFSFTFPQVTRTITKEVDKPYPVEKELSWWQQTKIDIGGLSLGLNIILLAGIIIYWIRRITR